MVIKAANQDHLVPYHLVTNSAAAREEILPCSVTKIPQLCNGHNNSS